MDDISIAELKGQSCAKNIQNFLPPDMFVLFLKLIIQAENNVICGL